MTSNGQIIRSLDGIKCISEMPPHMYLSTIVEPSLQTILLSKWSTFPRFLSFIISAIIGFLFISYSTEIPILFASQDFQLAHSSFRPTALGCAVPPDSHLRHHE